MIGADVPVLMYHSVAADPPDSTQGLSVHPDDFARQLDVLVEDRFTTVTFADLARARRGEADLPDRPIVLTFDDGYADFADAALPALLARGHTGTLFVTTGWLADAGRHVAGRPLDRTLTWSQVTEIAASPVEVGAHSHSHAQLDQLPPGALHEELSLSKRLLEERLGRDMPSLAYPYGYSDRSVIDGVRHAGYHQAAAVTNAMAGVDASRWAVPRLTIKRSTSIESFRELVHGRSVARLYRVDHALTAGYAIVRRGRRLRRALAGEGGRV